MPYRLARTPWAVAARGVAAAAFGLLSVAWATITVAQFIALFAAFALVDGVLTLVVALRFRSRGRDVRGPRDPLFALGAAGVLGGLAAAVWPAVTMQGVLALIALWAAATGVAQLVLATRARGRLPGAWQLGAVGVAALLLAFVLAGALAVEEVRVGWPVALYGLASGALLGRLGWRLVRAQRAARGPTAGAKGNPVPG
mgnify:CR=1 FL=1